MHFRSFRQIRLPKWRHGLVAGSFLLLAGCIGSSERPSPSDAVPSHELCRVSDEARQWLQDALGGWKVVLRQFLKRSEHQLPQIIAYDSRCSYSLSIEDGSRPRWTIAAHDGQVQLPNGASIPPAPNAFNAATDEGQNFVVMSLPSIWRPVAPKSEIRLEWFLEGVMLHELAHAYQSAVTPALSFAALHREHSLPANVSDDSVQEAFQGNPAYVREYETERDLLYRAASAPSYREAQSLTCEALAKLRTRRDRYFTGANAQWKFVDELSLTTEGLGQWVAYAWLTKKRGLAPALVLEKLRSPFWSQDEGLAVFLVVDRLVPGWQKLLFASSPATAKVLLERACGR